jgi:hypothetical protein
MLDNRNPRFLRIAGWAGGAMLLALAVQPTAASAQQVLNYGRAACNGAVSLATAREQKMVVGNLGNTIAAVTSNRIAWQCDSQPPQTFECPPSTNMVQIDRRQGGVNFSIICLRR